MTGYGRAVPAPPWPNKAKLAVQIVVNYEEGGERCCFMVILNQKRFYLRSSATDWLASGIGIWDPFMNMARTGFWRLYALFTARGIPITVFGVATALARARSRLQR